MYRALMQTKRPDQRRPLTPQDTEEHSFGCRHSNPDICKNNQTEGKCAFVRPDGLCLMPPRTWKAIFLELKADVEAGRS